MWMQPGGIMLALLRLPTTYQGGIMLALLRLPTTYRGASCSALVVVWYPHVSLRYLK